MQGQEQKLRFVPPVQEMEVSFSHRLKEAEGFFARLAAPQIVLLADENTDKLFGSSVRELLHPWCTQLLTCVVPPGEEGKTRKAKEAVEDFLLGHLVGRDARLVCLGGGALLDLGGFVASTFARGIALAFLPTTLIAMCDACLGGKTGINTPYGKNTLGTFYLAEHVHIAFEFLSSLSDVQMREGLAEIIKYALVADPYLWDLLQTRQELWEKRSQDFLQELVLRGLAIKKRVVEEDMLEKKGLRRILNFGHTIGHAIEAWSDFSCSHGEAVAIGIAVESKLSQEAGLLEEEYQAILSLLKNYGFAIPPLPSYEALRPFLSLDKKGLAGQCRCVLLSGIGRAEPFSGEYCQAVEGAKIREALVSTSVSG